MDVQQIKSEEDYDRALAEVTRYFDNQPELGTPESDRFVMLLNLIETYEDEYWPIKVADPIDH